MYNIFFKSRIYFIPAKQEGQSHAKGKLIERWKNVSRRLRKVGALKKKLMIQQVVHYHMNFQVISCVHLFKLLKYRYPQLKLNILFR